MAGFRNHPVRICHQYRTHLARPAENSPAATGLFHGDIALSRLHRTRILILVGALLVLACAAGLVLYALRQNINLFYTPTDALRASLKPGQVIRLGGLVERHSVHYTPSGDRVVFAITDGHQTISVAYAGVLPTLFREGQGIVVTGTLSPPDRFEATQVLAKHDEKYRPPVFLKEPSHAA